MHRVGVLFAVLAAASVAPVSTQSVITTSSTRAHVEALASERFEGRLAGSNGERLAAEYIVRQLDVIGARPLPGLADYRLPFEFTAGTSDGGSSVSVGEQSGADNPAWRIQSLSFSDNAEVTGSAVFAGYGIVVPDSQSFGYDSYVGLDVRDKIVVVLRYFPEDADADTKSILARYSGLRFKAMAARQRGAKALLVVTGPRSPNAGELVPMTFDTALAGSGIVAASVTPAVAAAIFSATDTTLEETQRELDSGNPHVTGFDIPDRRVTVNARVVRETRTGTNLAAYLPATIPVDAIGKPWIAIGAHYDHLGRGGHGNSLAAAGDVGNVHLGADDNASGTSAVLAIAERLARQPLGRNVALLFWSGEELGLLGSSAFIDSPSVPLDELSAYLNLDMVGRMVDNRLTVQAAGTSPVWARVLERANIASGFDLHLQQDPHLPTDSASFNQAEIPTLNFFTGTHADYHKPSDTPERIEYEDLDRVVDFATAIARRLTELEEAPAFTKVRQQIEGGGRAEVRVFTGTIPDYTSDVEGLLLGGVVGGGPAEAAGLREGDVIVEIAGRSIANIYDYTYALEVLKIGEPTTVIYLRDGNRIEATLTPAARR
jgi:hypothetical protein